MKVLKYQIAQKVNYGTDDEPNIGLMLAEKSIDWNEVNEESAKREAYNGEPTVEDDGQPEPEDTSPVTWAALAAAYSEGVNEA